MNSKPLYLNENLKNELDDAEKKSDVIKAKKILALKLLDQSHLKDGEQPKTVKEVSELLNLSEKTIYKLLKNIEDDDGSLEDLLSRKKYDGRCRVVKYDANFEAKAIQIACSEPPKGAHHWTIKLIAEKLVKLDIYANVSTSAVQRALSRNNLKPHKSEYWKIPPKQNAAFVAAMEHVIDIYNLPYNPKEPVICLDETTRQLLVDVKQPLLPKPNHTYKQDDEYIRLGVASIFLAVEPLTCRTFVSIGDTRTQVDFANFIKCLSKAYPDAEKIHVVLDNLNTHTVASLYIAFDPEFAHQIASRFCFHYTPKHGSWLNMAESSIGHFKTFGLRDRIGSIDEMRAHTSAYLSALNNGERKPYKWTFTVQDARVKLKSIYPDFVIKDKEFYESFTSPNIADDGFLDSYYCSNGSSVFVEQSTMSNLDGELSIRINCVV